MSYFKYMLDILKSEGNFVIQFVALTLKFYLCIAIKIEMILSPCIEVKTFSPSIIYTYILIVVQINKVFFIKVLFY